MKKKIALYMSALLFCVSVSCVSVLAVSSTVQSPVGVGFVSSTNSTSSTNSSSSSTTPTGTTSSTISSSSTFDSSTTVESSSKNQIVPVTNGNGSGSNRSYWNYITDTASKVLPKTGEFINKNISLIGMAVVAIIFFYLVKSRRKKV